MKLGECFIFKLLTFPLLFCITNPSTALTKCEFKLSVISVGFEINLFPVRNSNFSSFTGDLKISLLISRHMALVLSVTL